MNIRLASRGRRHISLFQQAGSLFLLAFRFLPAACLLVEIAQRHHALVFRALSARVRRFRDRLWNLGACFHNVAMRSDGPKCAMKGLNDARNPTWTVL